MIFTKDHRTAWDDAKLGVVFGFYGGYCNAAAVVLLLHEISPMSANWGGMAKALGNMDISKVFTFLPLILCFITGAFFGAKWAKKGSPLSVVILEAALLVSTALIAKEHIIFAIGIGGLTMGLQNGMSTQLTHHRVRTTHLTSTVTDIGISLARRDYKDVLVKGSKTITFIWGAFVGAFKANLLGHLAFAFGGLYLFAVTLIVQILLPRCAGCLERDSLLREWFSKPSAALSQITTEN